MDMFQQDSVILYNEDESDQIKSPQTYDEVVKDLIMDEKQYLRDLQMITKVFRDTLQKSCHGRDIDIVFSNINELMELTMTLISSLEDTLEMTEEGNVPAIGKLVWLLPPPPQITFSLIQFYKSQYLIWMQKHQ